MTANLKASAYFQNEINSGQNFFFGGREDYEVEELSAVEIAAISKCIDIGVGHLQKVSPIIAADFARQKPALIKYGAIAKAKFPGKKGITFPSQAGGIGVNFIVPELLNYYTTPGSSYPCYSDYSDNTWNISLTSGSTAYILGSAAAHYKASLTSEQHSLMVIAENGLLEIGTTPRFEQQRIISQADTKYGVFTANPLVEVPIDPIRTIYQHPTLGILPCFHDFGVTWTIAPKATGTAKLKLLGLVYYEHDLMSDLKYV